MKNENSTALAAKRACKKLGGDLAQFSSLASYKVLKDFVLNRFFGLNSLNNYWIGLKKLENSRTLKWSSSQMNVSNWVSKVFSLSLNPDWPV